ncbi:MAG: uroporphyrin-III C/tetrapyrrole (Corrin/Porphyrin) methyltransferase, rRNA [Candidatus Parcubacteria bacterium]
MGTLSVVATPIGNLEDITLRALRTLKECDVVFCEDTRVAGKLLAHYEIKKPLLRLDGHTEVSRSRDLISLLADGKKAVLISDAGTPGISDPGSRIVALVRESLGGDVKIETIPGPSALAALIAIAGIPLDTFTFYGFLPHKKGRQTLIKTMIASEHASMVYESPHRMMKLLDALHENAPERIIVVGRELTKLFEEVRVGTVAEVRTYFQKKAPRGEFVVILSGAVE